MTANVVSQSEFVMKFEGSANKMMNISRFMRVEQNWNGEYYTARSCILYIPHVMLRKLKEGNISAWGSEKCVQNYRPSHGKSQLEHYLVYFHVTRIKV